MRKRAEFAGESEEVPKEHRVFMGMPHNEEVLGYLDWLPVKMANTAHLLGLISGCLLALLENYPWKNSAIKKAG